jgi:intracellular septation protein A
VKERAVHWIWFIIGIGVLSMVVAAAISSGWVAFVVGVTIAAILVALVNHLGHDRSLGRRA